MRLHGGGLVALIVSSLCWAGASDGFAAHKQRVLDHIHDHQQLLANFETCVQAAGDKAALKRCTQRHRQAAALLKAQYAK